MFARLGWLDAVQCKLVGTASNKCDLTTNKLKREVFFKGLAS